MRLYKNLINTKNSLLICSFYGKVGWWYILIHTYKSIQLKVYLPQVSFNQIWLGEDLKFLSLTWCHCLEDKKGLCCIIFILIHCIISAQNTDEDRLRILQSPVLFCSLLCAMYFKYQLFISSLWWCYIYFQDWLTNIT